MKNYDTDQTMCGTHGELWVDDLEYEEVTAFKAELGLEFGDVHKAKSMAKHKKLGQNILGLNAPLLAMGGFAIKTGMAFDKSMSQVKAVSGSTSKEFISLRNEARRVGAETAKSATDAANGMVFLGQAGFRVNEVLKLTRPLTELAIAGNMEMAQASSLLADSLNSANIPMKDSKKFLDQIAKSSVMANTDVAQLMEAWIGAGGSLRTANITMAETNVLLSILSNAGIKSAEAGTSLSRIFMNINATSGDAGKAMKTLGINIADSSGKMRSKVDVLKELKSKTDKLTEAERNNYIQMIGGKQYANDLKILLDGMGGSFDKMTKEIDKSSGALGKLAKTMSDNLAGDIDNLSSAWEDAAINISDALQPMARGNIKTLTKLVEGLQKLPAPLIRVVSAVVIFSTAIGLTLVGLGLFQKMMGSSIISCARLIRFFMGLSSTVWIVMAVILALVVAGVLLYKNWDKIKEVAGKVRDSFLKFVDSTIGIKNIKNAIEDLKNKFKDFVKQIQPIIQVIGIILKVLFDTIKAILIPIGSFLISVLGGAFKYLLAIIVQNVMAAINIITGIIQIITGVAQFIVGIFQGDYKKAFDGLKKIVQGAVNIIKGLWKSLKAFLAAPIKPVIKLLSGPFHSAVNLAKRAWSALKSYLLQRATARISATASAFHNVIEGVKKAWNNLKTFLRNPIKGTINLIKHGSVDGEHRTGRGKIPFDGYRALLHKDEMVLNKHDADEYRKGNISSNSKTTIVKIAKLADTLLIKEKTDSEKLAKELAKEILLLA
ncbi:phage tail tape measure protein [Peptostreptococcus equinus]|uniref:Phage tail tape measure protein n=1 Tax=Peptostreptococcus equinus TaxID=3003601 RepID=A0ABY7JQG2_9FIRM|nr:phage tail tape measure protein [Peptostreptococcus sp. CBA3647]WAW14746.1 phage tail tape measure protein [Peptostreptococcus sp. CBA3647]